MPLGDVPADILLGYFTQAEFDANPGVILGAGQFLHLAGTDNYKRGDGSTVLSALPWRGTLRKTAATWTSDNTVLLAGQIGIETDTLKFKQGDGSTAWSNLIYVGGPYHQLTVLQSSFSTTSASFVDVPGMSVTLTAGKKYLIEGFFIAIPPFGGSGSAFQLVMPAGTASIVGNLNETDAIFRRVAELTATGAFPNQNPNVQLSYVRFSGSINVSVTGTFKLQTKSVVFNASHQVEVKPRSTWWKITEIP